MSLKDDLTDIDQIGETRAEEIIEIVNEHNDGVGEREVERVREMLERGSVRAAKSRLNDLL